MRPVLGCVRVCIYRGESPERRQDLVSGCETGQFSVVSVDESDNSCSAGGRLRCWRRHFKRWALLRSLSLKTLFISPFRVSQRWERSFVLFLPVSCFRPKAEPGGSSGGNAREASWSVLKCDAGFSCLFPASSGFPVSHDIKAGHGERSRGAAPGSSGKISRGRYIGYRCANLRGFRGLQDIQPANKLEERRRVPLPPLAPFLHLRYPFEISALSQVGCGWGVRVIVPPLYLGSNCSTGAYAESHRVA